ncbi:hypothetical protein APF79_10215 [bacterium BRH_c32]|nr:MAG: hypothetical protein APF79_10215 [bacterium BRH_c32]
MREKFIIYILFCLFAVVNTTLFSQNIIPKESLSTPWRFVVIGDTHVPQSDTVKEMIPFILEDEVDLILVCGDLVDAGKLTKASELESQLHEWVSIFSSFYDRGIGVYPVRGNHEDDATDDISVWNKIFTGTKELPQNGPSGEVNLTYSFIKNNAKFIGLDNYANIHKVNQEWLNGQLASNSSTHLFVFGHEAAFKVFHSDCLDDYPEDRNTFWKSMTDAGVRTYFCGHDHFYDVSRIDDNDGNFNNDIYQVLVGGGGGWLMSKYNFNGFNSPYNQIGVFHEKQHGYALVEISGTNNNDCDVTITWKERTFDIESSSYKYLATKDILKYTAEAKTKTSIENIEKPVPNKLFLEQNYPNPFNPQTTISFQLSEDGFVQLKIFDMLGREIAILVNEFKSSGYYEVNFDGSNLSSGIYFVQLSSMNFIDTIKMLLLK